MKSLHHAKASVMLPPDFVRPGWLCQRCERQVEIDEALGSPARCPKCHKPTAVWIPPAEPVLVADPRKEATPYERKYVTRERGAAEFEAMRALIEDVDEYRPDNQTGEGAAPK